MTQLDTTILLTTLFSSVLTLLFTILTKRFDSRESKLNREYERRVVLREKYEELHNLLNEYSENQLKMIKLHNLIEFSHDVQHSLISRKILTLCTLYFKDLKQQSEKMMAKTIKSKKDIPYALTDKNITFNNELSIFNNLIDNKLNTLLDDFSAPVKKFYSLLDEKAEKYTNIKIKN